MNTDFDDAIGAVLRWQAAGKAAALATVVETWGSAPRPVGSLLAISRDGELVGSVSGGCVEGAVVAEALDMIPGAAPLMLEFGVSDDEAFAVGLACGGRIRVMVEHFVGGGTNPALQAVSRARGEKRAIARVVDVASGAAQTVNAQAYPARFRADQSGFEGATFVTIHNPPLRMIIVGGVHIAQALVPMARIAGFEVTLIDPRAAFASVARFPDTTLCHDWPDEALAALEPDARTAIVTLTHDAKLDDPALEVALASEAFYIGCLGSTRTHGKRVTRLEGAGFTQDQIARLDAPVGLDIGARTPAEIAVAIMGQVVQTLRRP